MKDTQRNRKKRAGKKIEKTNPKALLEAVVQGTEQCRRTNLAKVI